MVKFDQVLSREKAMQPLTKVPEGAPFWKYYVKDAVITKPVKSYSISQNPENSHTYTAPLPKEAKNIEDFNCGKIHKRLEALKNKYEDLYDSANKDRYIQMQSMNMDERKTVKDDLDPIGEALVALSEVQRDDQSNKSLICSHEDSE